MFCESEGQAWWTGSGGVMFVTCSLGQVVAAMPLVLQIFISLALLEPEIYLL